MPTFREDLKLGTKVPLVKTDDIDDRAVTTPKLADASVTVDKLGRDVKKGLEDNIYEAMTGKFLPLEGGEMAGAITYASGTAVDDDVITAPMFKTTEPIGGLLTDNGEITMPLTTLDIDKLFD